MAEAKHTHHFHDVPAWVERFEAPERALWQKPAEVIAALDVHRGQRVADLGAGTGYFTLPLARAVGPEGVVYACDVEPGMVAHLAARAAREGAPMIRAVRAEVGTPTLPEPVDLAFLCNVYHHLHARPAWLARLRGALTPEGRVAIVDWRPRRRAGATDAPRPHGPPAELRLSERVVVAELRAAGLTPIERHTFLPEHYFLVFGAARRQHPPRAPRPRPARR